MASGFSVCWLFWLALRWHARGGVWLAAGYVSVGLAVIFRLEALVLEVALVLWLLPNVLSRLVGGGYCSFTGCRCWQCWLCCCWELATSCRTRACEVSFIKMLDPSQIQQDFQVLSEGFAQSLKYDFARDDAGKIG